MKISRSIILVVIGLFIVSGTYAQSKKKQRLRPGVMYHAGDTLYAPRMGFTTVVPQGWEGELPRENEVFLLSARTSAYGEIFGFGREYGEINAIRDSWMKGVDLSETIKLKALNPTIKDGVLYSEVTAEGNFVNKGNKGFAATACNPAGPCVTFLLVTPVQFYETLKNSVMELMQKSSFQPPSTASPYADFDWKEFLSNKVVINYAVVEGGTKESTIHLCADGSFSANIKKKGFFKEHNPLYTGKHKGTWTAEGTGPKTTIVFTFEKGLPPFETELSINDEKVFSNGERYFVGESDECK